MAESFVGRQSNSGYATLLPAELHHSLGFNSAWFLTEPKESAGGPIGLPLDDNHQTQYSNLAAALLWSVDRVRRQYLASSEKVVVLLGGLR